MPNRKKIILESLLLAAGAAMLFLAACDKPYQLDRPLTDQEKRGQRIYAMTCHTCHIEDSEKPLNGPGLGGMYRKPYLPSGRPANDEMVKQTVLQGRNNMVGYKGVLTDSQLNDLVAYLHTL